MKKYLSSLSCLLLPFLFLVLSSLGSCNEEKAKKTEEETEEEKAKKTEEETEEKPEETEEVNIDKLIALLKKDTALDKKGFTKVLQALKDGTWNIDDAFDTTTGAKREKYYKWDKRAKPGDWRTFVINVAEGGVKGDHIPYFEYAKKKGAKFDEIGKYGRNILHLLFDFDIDEATVNDLKWLLDNLDTKVIENIINVRKRNEDGSYTQNHPLDYVTSKKESTHKAQIIALLKSKGAKSGKKTTT